MSKSGFVAIVGRPNSGKSTLLNAILGSNLSIVTHKAQTTRERVLGILTEPEGQIVFVDTPGIHRAEKGGLNEYMVDEAKGALEGTSVIWYLVDPRSELVHERAVLDLLPRNHQEVFLLLNKSDTIRGVEARTHAQRVREAVFEAATELGIKITQKLDISATEKKGLSELMAKTWSLIEEGPLYYEDKDQLSDRPQRFFVAEMIREQLLLRLGDEVPYSCAVDITRFDEKAKPLRIEATIYVERESQKGIVIGKGAHKIKEIGQEARARIEEFLGQKIFLGLQVKLQKDWTQDELAMKRMGYDVKRKSR